MKWQLFVRKKKLLLQLVAWHVGKIDSNNYTNKIMIIMIDTVKCFPCSSKSIVNCDNLSCNLFCLRTEPNCQLYRHSVFRL